MNPSSETSPDALGRRFASRLQAILDQMRYPATPLDRARMLSQNLAIDEGLASTLLNGLMLPDWDLFLGICALTKCQPGYFLDDSLNQYPPETRLVKPLTSGENIVVRMPPRKGRSWGPSSAEWTYLRSKDAMGFGIQTDDFVVNFSGPADAQHVAVDNLYLLGVRNRYEVRTCIEVANGRAVMAGPRASTDSAEFLILPITSALTVDSDRMNSSGIHHFGEIASLLRSPDGMLATPH